MVLLIGMTQVGATPLVEQHPTAPMSVPLLRAFIDALTLSRWHETMAADAKYGEVIDLANGCSANRFMGCDDAKAASAPARALVYYNSALLEAAFEERKQTLAFVMLYLRLAPSSAPERGPMEQLRAQLEANTGTVTIGGRVVRGAHQDEVDALVLVDGVVVGDSPSTITVAVGGHIAERITTSTYARRVFETYKTWNPSYLAVDSSDEATGNVVIGGDLGTCTTTAPARCDAWTWREGSVELAVGKRFSLAKGHHVATSASSGACKPFDFEVGPATSLSYVRVEGTRAKPGACLDVKRVTTKPLAVHTP